MVKVRLKEVVDEIDMLPDGATAFLNRHTGELVTVGGDYAVAAEREDLEDLDESDDFLALPDKFDVHEWDIMRRFSRSIESAEVRDELLDAIHGRGAFRAFRAAAGRHGLVEDWYRFRQHSLEEIVREWLDGYKIAYE
jgi:hypothetical protein